MEREGREDVVNPITAQQQRQLQLQSQQQQQQQQQQQPPSEENPAAPHVPAPGDSGEYDETERVGVWSQRSQKED